MKKNRKKHPKTARFSLRLCKRTDGFLPNQIFFFLGIKTKNLANMTLDIYMEFQIHKIKLNIFKQKNRPKNQFYVFF